MEILGEVCRRHVVEGEKIFHITESLNVSLAYAFAAVRGMFANLDPSYPTLSNSIGTVAAGRLKAETLTVRPCQVTVKTRAAFPQGVITGQTGGHCGPIRQDQENAGTRPPAY